MKRRSLLAAALASLVPWPAVASGPAYQFKHDAERVEEIIVWDELGMYGEPIVYLERNARRTGYVIWASEPRR